MASEAGARTSLLIHHIEYGARHLSPLQLLAEATAASEGGPGLHHLLDFIEDDIVDVFRCVAIGAASLVPGPDWKENADPPEVQAEARLLARYLWIGAAAAQQEGIPADVRHAFAAALTAMVRWDEELVQLIDEIAENELLPAAGE